MTPQRAPSVSEHATREGQLIAGKYRVGRLLGVGGMGHVHEAHHDVVGRPFAVKFLHQDLSQRPEMVERFRYEAMISGALVNEHIVAVLDFGVAEDGAPFLVMERLEGEDLARSLDRGPWPADRVAELAVQTCRGLTEAHARGLVHRDLKPANLFLCQRSDGSLLVKILDFGIATLHACSRNPAAASPTLHGGLMGTPHYMSPEQARGSRQLDHRLDLYALGVILYESLTGSRPHTGKDFHEVLYRVLTYPPRPLAALRPDLPAALCDLVHWTMAFDPEDRPQSATELAERMAPYVSSAARERFRAAPANFPTPSVPSTRSATPTMEAPPVTPAAEPRPAARPGIRRWLLAALPLLLAAGWRLGEDTAPANPPARRYPPARALVPNTPRTTSPTPDPAPLPTAPPVAPPPARRRPDAARPRPNLRRPDLKRPRGTPAREMPAPTPETTTPGPLPLERANPYQR